MSSRAFGTVQPTSLAISLPLQERFNLLGGPQCVPFSPKSAMAHIAMFKMPPTIDKARSESCSLFGCQLVDFRLENADVGEIAVFLVVVKPVADHKLIGN